MNNKPIGIFDSGIGGLTVFKEISRLLPHENLIYLGDTLRVPYGSRSKETIVKYSIELVNYLIKQDVKMLVIACNTISANALIEIERLVKIPIIEVITPTVDEALIESKSKHIGVIGTEATILSGAYQSQLSKAKKITTVACPLLVPLIESGQTKSNAAKEIVNDYLSQLSDIKIDVLILGCTHYPIISNLIRMGLKNKTIKVIDSAIPTAKNVQKTIKESSLENISGYIGFRRMLVTDDPEKSRRISRIFMKEDSLSLRQVKLIKN